MPNPVKRPDDKRKQSHWYRIYVGECPVCGSDKGFRERVNGPKPSDRNDRVVHMSDAECYDHCDN